MPPLEENLDLLLRRLHGLSSRRPGFALTLVGEAGIGKSFTARALLSRVSCATFSGHATQSLSSVLLSLPRPKKCPAPLERTLERLQNSETFEHNVLQDALRSLLSCLAPFVLCLEDLHECTAEQLERWNQLALSLPHLRGVALLSSSRTIPPDSFEVLALEPLSSLETRELLEAEVHTALPPEALEWIYSKAAGNPLYTLEFFRSLARAGFAWSDGQRWHWREPLKTFVPVSVEALIERLLIEATSSNETQAALEVLALQPEVDEPLRRAVCGLEEEQFQAALYHLHARGILKNSGFAHPLYREMTLKNLSAQRRQMLSRKALEALELTDIEAAAGFVEGAALDRERALELLKKAASSAKDRGDLPGAGRFLAQAVGLASGVARGELALEAAQALRSSDVVRALELAEQASQFLPESTEATLLWATTLAYAGRGSESEALLAQLPQDQRTTLEGQTRHLILLAAAGQFGEVVALWDAHPELRAVKDPELMSQVSFSLSAMGQPDRAEALVEDALSWDALPLERRCQLLSGRGTVLFRRGEYDAAEVCFTEALDIAWSQNIARGIPALSFNRGYLRICTHQLEAAAADLEQAASHWAAMGNLRWYAHAQVNLALIAANTSRFEDAEERLLKSLNLLEGGDPNDSLYDCLAVLCKLYETWETPRSGVLLEKYARRCMVVAELLGGPRSLSAATRFLGVVELRIPHLSRALELFDRALELSEMAGVPSMRAQCHLSRAEALKLLGRDDEARQALEQAKVIAELLKDCGLTLILDLELARLRGDLDLLVRLRTQAQSEGSVGVLEHIRRSFPKLASSESNTRLQTQILRLEVLGPMLLGGQSVRGGKRQELLKVLLEARISGKSEVSTLELLDALYPAENEEPATTALKQTVYKARSSCGPGVIVTTSGGYALGNVSSDAEEFLHTGNTHLWRGVYSPLEGSGAGQETLILALKSASVGLQGRDPQETARVARILCEMDPYDLESLKLLLSALKASQNYKSLGREYGKGCTRLLEVGEILPQTWADFLGTFVPAHSL